MSKDRGEGKATKMMEMEDDNDNTRKFTFKNGRVSSLLFIVL